MSTLNLIKVFAPTIVGYSIASPEPMQMISETQPQQAGELWWSASQQRVSREIGHGGGPAD